MESDVSFQGLSPIKIEPIIRKKNKINKKKNQKNKKMINYVLKNTFIFSIFLISYYLYYLSLEKCFDGADVCGKNLKWIRKIVIQEISSCVLITILLQLAFYKIISRFHLFHLIIAFFSFYKYSHGYVFDDHGYFNFIGFIGVCSTIIISFLPINWLIYFIRKKNKKGLLYYILSIITIILLIYGFYSSNYLNCDNWKYGLNNTYIQNNVTKYGCQIRFPDKCPDKIFKHFLDINKIKRIKCQNSKKDGIKGFLKKSNSPYLNKNKTFKLVGYPILNKAKPYFLDFPDNHNLLREHFLNNLIDMENKEILDTVFKNQTPEIYINFTNSSLGNMIINLNYNKTLSEERKAKEKNMQPYSNNILSLFIDSVSRANSLRQLKKTTKFIENFMSYEGNNNKVDQSHKFHSFQFFKYHSFKDYTPENYPQLFYGKLRENKHITSINKYLRNSGYITGYASDICMRENVRMLHNLPEDEGYDHAFMNCDPNSDHFNKNTLKCLYGKMVAEHLFEYGNQFWRKYKDNRKFFNINCNDGHEGSLEGLKYNDDLIYNFLNNLYNDNLLKDSSIFLISDHGVGVPSAYYYNLFYQLEFRLPMLYIIVNDRKNISYSDQYMHINENQQTFITAYDIYNTFINLIYGDKYELKYVPKSHNGKSLFKRIDPKPRTPFKYYPMSKFACSIQ